MSLDILDSSCLSNVNFGSPILKILMNNKKII